MTHPKKIKLEHAEASAVALEAIGESLANINMWQPNYTLPKTGTGWEPYDLSEIIKHEPNQSDWEDIIPVGDSLDELHEKFKDTQYEAEGGSPSGKVLVVEAYLAMFALELKRELEMMAQCWSTLQTRVLASAGTLQKKLKLEHSVPEVCTVAYQKPTRFADTATSIRSAVSGSTLTTWRNPSGATGPAGVWSPHTRTRTALSSTTRIGCRCPVTPAGGTESTLQMLASNRWQTLCWLGTPGQQSPVQSAPRR